MKATLILADSGQTDPAGKLHALGLGWSVTSTPTPPITLLALIDCPWDQANVKHQFVIELLDADGHVVSFNTDAFGSPQPAVRIEAEFEAGRPPGIPAGTPLRQPFSLTLGPGVPLVAGQKYEFRLTIDGEVMDSSLSTFLVRPAPPAFMGQ